MAVPGAGGGYPYGYEVLNTDIQEQSAFVPVPVLVTYPVPRYQTATRYVTGTRYLYSTVIAGHVVQLRRRYGLHTRAKMKGQARGTRPFGRHKVITLRTGESI